MKRYIKPETSIVDVDIESLMLDTSFSSGTGGTVDAGGPKPSKNPETDAAAKDFDGGLLWGCSWDDESLDEDDELQ